MGAAEYRRLAAGGDRPGGSKYRNRRVKDPELGNFDSEAEYRHFKRLQLMERAGEISELRRQVPFVLAKAVTFGQWGAARNVAQ